MDDKKLDLSEQTEELSEDRLDALEELAKHAVDTLEEDLAKKEVLQEHIRVLEEKEKVLTEKLCIAKDKGMHEQADRCRCLLQRVVLNRNRKCNELKETEERIRKAKEYQFMARFAHEVDALTTEVEKDILGKDGYVEKPEQAPLFEAEYDHKSKAKRLSFIASTFVWVGVLSGLIGALLFMILVEYQYAVFSWTALSVFGILTVLMLVFAICFGAGANKHKRLAKEIALEIAEQQANYEAAMLRRQHLLEKLQMISQLEDAEDIAEAYAIEKAGDEQRETQKAIRDWIPDLSDAEKIKKGVIKAVSITAACATVAALLISSKRKRAKEQGAAQQKEIEMLYRLLERDM